jgi:hypothetical protein
VRAPAATIVLALGVFQIAVGKLLERPLASLRSALGCWITTFGNAQHHLGGQPARIAEADRISCSKMEPTRASMVRVNAFERFVAALLNAERKAAAARPRSRAARAARPS